jgi:hypothetical protein
VATASFSLGIMFIFAIEKSMQHDQIYVEMLLLVVPLTILAIGVNARRILREVP